MKAFRTPGDDVENRQNRVLIVEDEAVARATLSAYFKKEGYLVSEARDGREMRRILDAEIVDLILLDIVLPGMSGFEALRHLRRNELTRNIPIIMISGNEQATEQFYLQRIGADDFMKKPFTRADVYARIGHLLGPDQLPHRHLSMPTGGMEHRMRAVG